MTCSSTNVPHLPWAVHAMQFPFEEATVDQVEAQCKVHAALHAPSHDVGFRRFINMRGAGFIEWYWPKDPPGAAAANRRPA